MVQLYPMDYLMWQNCNNDSVSQINYGVAEETQTRFHTYRFITGMRRL